MRRPQPRLDLVRERKQCFDSPHGCLFLFLVGVQIEPDAKSIGVTLIDNEIREFEFFVKLPELLKTDQPRP